MTNVKNIQEFLKIDGICRKPTVKMAKIWPKIIPKYLTSYRNWSTFGLSTLIENVPTYSTFDYQLSRYIFPKLLKKLKLLPERMGLEWTLYTIIINNLISMMIKIPKLITKIGGENINACVLIINIDIYIRLTVHN